jgi:DNA invertase Pin-like site-specific DNA recombinase
VVLTAHLSSPSYAFRRLCEQDLRGLIERKGRKQQRERGQVRTIQRRLTPEQVTELGDAYRAGSTVRQVAARFGINRTTVLEHLDRLGIPRRANQRKLTDQQVAEARRLYEEGQSLADLGSRFGVHSETVRRELSRVGVVIRPAGRRQVWR